MIANVVLDNRKKLNKNYINYLKEIESLNFLFRLDFISADFYKSAIVQIKNLYNSN